MDLSRFLQAARQGCVDPFGVCSYWKDSPSPPPAPDYKGAAEATAQGNLQNSQVATAANRANQYTPYGSLTWSQANPGDPASQWSQQVNLSPTGQSLLDASNNSQLGIARLLGGATGSVANTMGQPFNYNGPDLQTSVNQYGVNPTGAQTSFGNYPGIPEVSEKVRTDAEQAAYGRATSRLDPQWGDRQTEMETQLRNQGLVPGGEAYDKAARNMTFARNDAYDQARQGAVQQGLQAQQAQFGMGMAANQAGYGQALGKGQFANQGLQQMYGQRLGAAGQNFNQGLASAQFGNQAGGASLDRQLALYNLPLNQLSALRSGSQVTNPQFGNYAQQQAVPGANYSGAAGQQGTWDTNLYNQGVTSANEFNKGLMNMGSAAIPLMFSDHRLKSNIVQIGTHPLGIGIYEYDIFGEREVGVMAQEVLTVKPEAVLTHPSGFLMVDYGRL